MQGKRIISREKKRYLGTLVTTEVQLLLGAEGPGAAVVEEEEEGLPSRLAAAAAEEENSEP